MTASWNAETTLKQREQAPVNWSSIDSPRASIWGQMTTSIYSSKICKMQSTCKQAFIWTKQTYPYNQGYIYVGQDQAIRTNKDIYVVKR